MALATAQEMRSALARRGGPEAAMASQQAPSCEIRRGGFVVLAASPTQTPIPRPIQPYGSGTSTDRGLYRNESVATADSEASPPRNASRGSSGPRRRDDSRGATQTANA